MAKKKNCGCTEKPWRRPPDYEPDEEWLPRCCPEEFVVEYDSIENFPRIGEKLKLYISTSDNSLYIWKEAEQPEVGGQYVKISNVLELGITHNDAADGYFANKQNNQIWDLHVKVEGNEDTYKNENGDSAFLPGIYPNIIRGCPNFLINGQRKWLGGAWIFFVVTGYNKDLDKYHIYQIAKYKGKQSDVSSADLKYYMTKYIRHISWTSLYTWEGNPQPTFDEWTEFSQDNYITTTLLDILNSIVDITDNAINPLFDALDSLTYDSDTHSILITDRSHEIKAIIPIASLDSPGLMTYLDKDKLDNIEQEATKSRIYQGSNPINLHDLLFNSDNFHVETTADGRTHEITLENRRVVITPDLSTHTVSNNGKGDIERCFKKYGDLSKLWARIDDNVDGFNLVSVLYYNFLLTRLDETNEVYDIVVSIHFGDTDNNHIEIFYTDVDLTNGFEAYGLSRLELGL